MSKEEKKKKRTVECACGRVIATHDEVCFYNPKPHGWHLIVKAHPQVRASVDANVQLAPFPRAIRMKMLASMVCCAGCGAHIANEGRIGGPQREPVICFFSEAVRLEGHDGPRPPPWEKARRAYPSIKTISSFSFAPPGGSSGGSSSSKAAGGGGGGGPIGPAGLGAVPSAVASEKATEEGVEHLVEGVEAAGGGEGVPHEEGHAGARDGPGMRAALGAPPDAGTAEPTMSRHMAEDPLTCVCGHHVCTHGDLAFYRQGAATWHLIVKPEPEIRAAAEGGLRLVPHPRAKSRKVTPRKMMCGGCGSDVGEESRVGPRLEACLCFDVRRVRLGEGAPPASAKKWADAMRGLPHVDVREGFTFCPVSLDDRPASCLGHLELQPTVRPEPKPQPQQQAQGAARDSRAAAAATAEGAGGGGDEEERPTDRQVALASEALKGNTVVVLPPDEDRWWVPVMVTRRMKLLNPAKLAVVLTDQASDVRACADEFRKKGGLRVQEFADETDDSDAPLEASPYFLEELLGSCHVAVLSGHAFRRSLAGGFPMGACCVLVFADAECAAAPSHAYGVILERFYQPCPLAERPQITAVTSLPSAELSLGLMRKHTNFAYEMFTDSQVIVA